MASHVSSLGEDGKLKIVWLITILMNQNRIAKIEFLV